MSGVQPNPGTRRLTCGYVGAACAKSRRTCMSANSPPVDLPSSLSRHREEGEASSPSARPEHAGKGVQDTAGQRGRSMCDARRAPNAEWCPGRKFSRGGHLTTRTLSRAGSSHFARGRNVVEGGTRSTRSERTGDGAPSDGKVPTMHHARKMPSGAKTLRRSEHVREGTGDGEEGVHDASKPNAEWCEKKVGRTHNSKDVESNIFAFPGTHGEGVGESAKLSALHPAREEAAHGVAAGLGDVTVPVKHSQQYIANILFTAHSKPADKATIGHCGLFLHKEIKKSSCREIPCQGKRREVVGEVESMNIIHGVGGERVVERGLVSKLDNRSIGLVKVTRGLYDNSASYKHLIVPIRRFLHKEIRKIR
ncbi:hypothetical protein B0H19DRAFT_1056957 [Mycena capillaripes]|nr:hypothetical protein B0H19DRAFT_1056957 [Mycena capillaripes]